MFLWKAIDFQPSHIQHLRDPIRLAAVGGDQQKIAFLLQNLGAGLRNRSCGGADVGPLFNLDAQKPGCRCGRAHFWRQLVGRLKDPNPVHGCQLAYLRRLLRCHPHLKSIVGQIAKQLCPGGCNLVFPSLLHGSLKLDDIITTLTGCIATNRCHTGGNHAIRLPRNENSCFQINWCLRLLGLYR